MDGDRKFLDWLFRGGWSGVLGAGVLGLFVFIASLAGFPGAGALPFPVMLVIGMAFGYVVGLGVGKAVLGSSGAAAQTIYMPSGAGSAYLTQYSHIDTLEVRGNVQGAVDAWEAVAIREPRNPWPLIRAGELYMRSLRAPTIALERFMLARDVSTITIEHRMYVTQKIIDLYLGPLADKGRALVELRRLADSYPGRRESQFAREAIARLKADG